MTVSTTNTRVVLAGNDMSTLIPLDFVFLLDSHLVVTLWNSSSQKISSAGDVTNAALTITTDYTVAGGSGATGSVSLTFTPETGQTVSVERIVPLTQLTDLVDGGPFRASTQESTYDLLCMMAQQISEAVGRSLILPANVAEGTTVTVPAPIANQLLIGNDAEDGYELIDPSTALGDATLVSIPLSVADGGTAGENAASLTKARYAIATGSANAFDVALSPAPTSNSAGQRVTFKANHTITGAATLNTDGVGDVAIVDTHGTALEANDIQSGGVYTVEHDGTSWVLTGYARPFTSRLSDVKEFTTSDTWGKPTNLDYIEVEVVGGGGGGGGCATTGSGGRAAAGGGGGGEYRYGRIDAADLGATETVTVGATGAAGAAGNNDGSNGGDSSFGAHIIADHGNGGTGSDTSANYQRNLGGEGGTGGTGGDFDIQGDTGGAGMCLQGAGTITSEGTGGGSAMGGSRAGGSEGEGGLVGRRWGGGGTGAFASENTTEAAGGAGNSGIVIVKEYTFSEVDAI